MPFTLSEGLSHYCRKAFRFARSCLLVHLLNTLALPVFVFNSDASVYSSVALVHDSIEESF